MRITDLWNLPDEEYVQVPEAVINDRIKREELNQLLLKQKYKNPIRN